MSPRAALVTVGDELLLGQTVDTNAAWLSRRLAAAGIAVVRRHTVADIDEEIRSGVRAAMDVADLVLVSGGLGPTPDDLTQDSVAGLFGVPFTKTLENVHGTAPGLVWDAGDTLVVLLPGVPRELKSIFEGGLRVLLAERFGNRLPPVHLRLIHTTGIRESVLSERVAEVLPEAGVLTLAFLPDLRGVDLRLTAQGLERSQAEAEFDRVEAALRPVVDPYRFESPDGDIAGAVLEALRAGKLTLATAESCTGGLVGKRITDLPGSSDVYRGGVVAYANDVKTALLGVEGRVIDTHGAVSEEVVRRMAEGVVRALDADVGVAVTGVAGPDGGTPEKPVGTVWHAATLGGRTVVEVQSFHGNRDAVRERAAQAVLFLLLRLMDGRL